MLNFLNKPWKRRVFVFLIIFSVGFVIGYLTMTWQFYKENWGSIEGINFWEALSPF